MIMTMVEAGKLGALASRITHNTLKQQRVLEYNNNPILCNECSQPIPYDIMIGKKSSLNKGKIKHLFCNHSCAAKFHNKTRIKLVKCKQCDTIIKRNSKHYCCHKCEQLYKLEQKCLQFFTYHKVFYRNTIKKILIHKYGKSCMMPDCAWDMSKKNTVLEIDHVDGNSENWHPNNMRLICLNCHSQTETYKGKNFGKGRFKRRQRYKAGLSY